jgi:hypothetical protein
LRPHGDQQPDTVDRLAVAAEGLGPWAAPVPHQSGSQAVHQGDVRGASGSI